MPRALPAVTPGLLGLLGLALLPAGAPARAGDPPAEESGSPAAAAGAPFESTVEPFVERYCTGCHGERRQRAGLSFAEFGEAADVTREREVWEKVLHMLRERKMPPEDETQPSEEERARIVEWVATELDSFDCTGPVDPGHVTVRRLNRTEYDNTLRDLLAVDVRPAREFPADDTGYGFDNIGDVLSLPPLLFEKYLDAAETAVSAALAGEPPAFRRRVQAEEIEGTPHSHAAGGALFIGREAEAVAGVEVPEAGLYRLRVRGWGEQAGPDPVRMALRIDGEELRRFEVANREDAPRTWEVAVRLEPGQRRMGVAYLNNWKDFEHPDPDLRGDRNLFVDWLELQLLSAGSFWTPDAPESRRRLVPVRPDGDRPWREALRESIRRLGRRAWRRPLGPEHVERLAALGEGVVDDGEPFAAGTALAAQAALVAPRFLFRVELDPEGSDVMDREGSEAAGEPVGDWALASRLSYFLWSSMPDEELLELAGAGELQDPETLRRQADRLLADPRSRAFVENFAGQWLQTRFLREVSPDPERYSGWSEELARDMGRETLRFFESVVREDRSVLELLDADYTFVNERLARHYGMEGVEGQEMRRVSLEESPRGGILTQASFLTITSNPTRTSPVKRGLWVLERILGTPPPPPPPDVPELSEEPEAILSGSLRERMERHREDPACASCHEGMDAIGFAFENFDAVGRWREFDGEFLIDPSGTLPDGSSFDGPRGLKQVLLERKELFVRTLVEKVLTYSLGRGLEYYDKCAVDAIVDRMRSEDYRFGSLIHGVVESRPFRMQRGGGAP